MFQYNLKFLHPLKNETAAITNTCLHSTELVIH
jgi:hypothetical protein